MSELQFSNCTAPLRGWQFPLPAAPVCKCLLIYASFSKTVFSFCKLISAPLPSLVGTVKIAEKICENLVSNRDPRISWSCCQMTTRFRFVFALALAFLLLAFCTLWVLRLPSLPNVTSNEAWALCQLSSSWLPESPDSSNRLGGFAESKIR